MENKTNKYIAVSYKLYVKDENGKHLVEETKEGQPFKFISGFGIALDAFENNIIPKAEGQRFNGRVLEVGDQKVKIDLNHPLAGETLQFEGKVLENRDATENEINQLIKHLTGGCGGCGGGNCGDCGGGDCDCGNCNG